jgi:hypothetical protein
MFWAMSMQDAYHPLGAAFKLESTPDKVSKMLAPSRERAQMEWVARAGSHYYDGADGRLPKHAR